MEGLSGRAIANFPWAHCSTKYRIYRKQTLNSYCWIWRTATSYIDYNYEEEDKQLMYKAYQLNDIEKGFYVSDKDYREI
jgi:valyl-tRNA synthetase